MVSANQTNMIPAEVTTKEEVVEIPKALPAPKEPKVRKEQWSWRSQRFRRRSQRFRRTRTRDTARRLTTITSARRRPRTKEDRSSSPRSYLSTYYK
ncbi:unnamed protein product [Lasius platythorax]|uniref:Uncharacterized protein n=1 Tax=Lasius platythorax TaxID=488582 RepID=A0AAV2MXF9_9HYME